MSRCIAKEEIELRNSRVARVFPSWLSTIKESALTSSFFKQLKDKLSYGGISDKYFKKMNGVWFYNDKVLLDQEPDLCEKVFLDLHAAPSRGNSRYPNILQRIRHSFWWRGMKAFVRSSLRACEMCQCNKHELFILLGC